MTPPPSTPTPWRFILPSRATQSSPNPTAAPRFQSTPRFGPLSTARTTERRRRLGHDDIEEDEDEVHESSLEGVDVDMEGHGNHKHDQEKRQPQRHESIEPVSNPSTPLHGQTQTPSQATPDPESSGLIQDSHEVIDTGPWHRTPFLRHRDNKRRRVDLSPSPDPSQSLGKGPESRNDSDTLDKSFDEGESLQSIEDDIQLGGRQYQQLQQQQQPTFNAPPRFKPVEGEPETEGLPIAFSPQRKGVKYVTNGLAAQLQGWLSEVKGWEGVESSHPDPVLKATIDEVRPGRRMYLVLARSEPANVSRRFILAGEGRLTGLGQRAELGVGSVVVVAQPVWDVELEGETWIVACDWHIE